MKGKLILYIVWCMAAAAVLMFTIGGKRESTQFYGIAETREISVNSENPVEIKKINVVPGQVISRNELIAELHRPELDMQINDLSHQLEELRAKKLGEDNAIKSQIKQLEAQLASTKSEIDYQIRQIETRHNINRELTTELKSLEPFNPKKETNGLGSPMDIKIESLKKELEMAQNLIRIKINLLKDELESPGNAYLVQMENLSKELVFLKEEKEKLLIYSQITGVIGSVNYKEGEKVSPFTPIVTLHTKSPSYVIGYIHENVYNSVSMGNTVDIASIADPKERVKGEVVGVGSRIVEYPVRLRRRPDIQLWGREVQIRLLERNTFLLGEKVLISPSRQNVPILNKIKQMFAASTPDELSGQGQKEVK